MAVPVIVLNLQGQILDANETALDLVGLPSQEVIGKWIGRFLTGEDLPELLDSLQLIAPAVHAKSHPCESPERRRPRDSHAHRWISPAR